MPEVVLNEAENWSNYRALNGLGVKSETLISGPGHVVLIIGGILVLLCEELQKYWYDLWGSNFREVK